MRGAATVLFSLLLRLQALAATPGPTGKPIKLLEPLPDGTTSLTSDPTNPFGILNQYINPMLSWMIGVAAGLALLMVVIGGVQIVISGGNDAQIGEGKKRITQAIIGLIMLVFSAAILSYLNAYFYKLV